MKIHQIFPSSIYQSSLFRTSREIKVKNFEIADEIQKIAAIDDLGAQWSQENYQGGYTSYSSYNQLHRFSTTFSEIQKKIDREVKKFAQKLEMDLGSGHLQMTHFWANVMPPRVTHSMHIHPLSVISGTYYVKTPKNCSAIKFEDPRLVHFMASPPRKIEARRENQRFISIQPQAGDLILFESWMRHEVPANQAQEERISISFNYEWC